MLIHFRFTFFHKSHDLLLNMFIWSTFFTFFRKSRYVHMFDTSLSTCLILRRKPLHLVLLQQETRARVGTNLVSMYLFLLHDEVLKLERENSRFRDGPQWFQSVTIQCLDCSIVFSLF